MASRLPPRRLLGGFAVSDTGRQFSTTIADLATQVSPILSTIQNGGTPSSTDVSNVISVLTQIGTQIQQLVTFDTSNVYAAQTSAMNADLPAVEKLFHDAQNNAARADPSTGFTAPLDSTEISTAVADWTDLLSQAGAVAGVANALDANLAQSEAGTSGAGPSQTTAPSTPNPSPSTSPPPGTPAPPSTTAPPTPGPATPGPLPTTPAGTPAPAPPPATTSSSILPTVTPAAAVAIGFGGILVIGVIVSALRGGAILNPLAPRRRRHRRARRRRSRR